ncbi:hypothetical protein B0H15DRAFT_292496 [Mycena belliarum]|uniref:Uncharacterized protein n=1 Tax=Mycena belliarum TaxID=1033014 RepID=A0AAD6U2V8_9AGAR|nr:hypothetical protein B0H15DRAFT_292496 [Mycena belliae]
MLDLATANPPVLIPDANTVIGPLFIGNSFNWMLMGTLLLQVYAYWLNFPRDTMRIKSLVYSVFVLDLLQTGFGTHEVWWFSVEKWGNTAALQGGSMDCSCKSNIMRYHFCACSAILRDANLGFEEDGGSPRVSWTYWDARTYTKPDRNCGVFASPNGSQPRTSDPPTASFFYVAIRKLC